MRIFTAIMVTLAVLATAVVSVRLHLQVAQLRYRVSGLEDQRVRAEREMRLAQAELEAAKAPRRLMERWSELRGDVASTTPAGGARTPAPAAGTAGGPSVSRPTAPVETEPAATDEEGEAAR